jgi:hypothetical protein
MLGVVMSLCAFIAQSTASEDRSRWLENDLGRLMRVAPKWLVSAAYGSTSKDGGKMEDPSPPHYDAVGASCGDIAGYS